MLNHKILIALFCVFAFQGCATLGENECKSGNWENIGYQDGSNGYPESRFNQHREACAEYKISPDYSAYLQGRQRGLEQVYCQPGKGYYNGLNGRGYANVCPGHLEPAFLAAYNYGRDIYNLQRDADKLKTDIRDTNIRITTLDQQIDILRSQLQHAKSGPKREDIDLHIEDELDRVMARLDFKTERAIHKLDLNHLKLIVNEMLNLSGKRGRIRIRLQWSIYYKQHNRWNKQQTEKMRSDLRHLDEQINNKRTYLKQQSRNGDAMKELNKLVQLAEYAGALIGQQNMLKHMHSHDERKDLAKFHYTQELPEFRTQPRDRHASEQRPHQGKANPHARRELRQALQKQERELHLLDDLNHQLQLLEQDIRHQKVNSPYR